MGTDSDDPYLREEEGGPTKSFLDHLEDLRWVLMKCAVVVTVTFLTCLFASPVVVKILSWPLERAAHARPSKIPKITFQFGTNTLGSYRLTSDQTNFFGTNLHTVLEIAPITVGSNIFLGLKPVTNAAVLADAQKTKLINLGPASAFFLAVQMALYGGVALASPFILFFVARFVFPALKITEKKYTYWGLGFGIVLFALGVCFCYFVLMPLALGAAAGYSEWMGFSSDIWRAEEYISFVCKFILGMGLGFELPVVLLVLVKIGLLDYAKLAGFRRYMIVINLILGAILTTPEVLTQVMMAVPLQLLYEMTIWIAWYWERKERKRNRTISI
ncbi:MAG: twin-arginine translocase subunit TatC [Verrucomicrobiota bacterium]